jgi:MoxR-like ATPase
MATATESKTETSPLDPNVKAIVAKTRDIRNEMKQEVVERGIEIDLLLSCIIGRVHMLMLGEPGVAKSMTVDQFLRHVEGAALFSVLLNKDTPPEMLTGPISFTSMKEDRFRRVTTQRLPEAHIAFIDEIFKSNATNLNSMLKIINERKFENDGSTIDVPLWSVIGASNELPTHDREDLLAFSDRLGIRRIVQPVKTEDGVKGILDGQLARNRGERLAESHTTLTLDEVETLQEAAKQIEVPGRVQDKIVKLRAEAEARQLHLSMRRIFEGVKVCQAQALLAERGEVKAEDLRLFEHVLWNDPEEIAIAQELTLDFAGTVGKQVARARGAFEEFQQRLSDAQSKMPADATEEPDKDVINELTTLSSQMRKLGNDVQQHIADAATEGHDASELESIDAELERARKSIRETMGMEF